VNQRDLEVFLDSVSAEHGDHTAIAAHQIRAILYASNDVFVVSRFGDDSNVVCPTNDHVDRY
jgi:hypothetical protein